MYLRDHMQTHLLVCSVRYELLAVCNHYNCQIIVVYKIVYIKFSWTAAIFTWHIFCLQAEVNASATVTD